MGVAPFEALSSSGGVKNWNARQRERRRRSRARKGDNEGAYDMHSTKMKSHKSLPALYCPEQLLGSESIGFRSAARRAGLETQSTLSGNQGQ